MNKQMTLKELKTYFELHSKQHFSYVTFLTTILPKYLYQNDILENNINLCGPYDSIKNWLSHLMNYTPCTKSGANHVRAVLLKLILAKPEVIHEIAQNCQELIPNANSLRDDIIALIKQDPTINKDFKEPITSLFLENCYLAFACCIVYCIFPDNKTEIINVLRPFCNTVNNNALPSSENITECLNYLQQAFTSFISCVKKNNYNVEPSDCACIHQLASCQRVLAYELLYTKIPQDFYNLLKKFVDQMAMLQYWDELHPTNNLPEDLNSLGRRMHHIAQMEIQLQELIIYFNYS